MVECTEISYSLLVQTQLWFSTGKIPVAGKFPEAARAAAARGEGRWERAPSGTTGMRGKTHKKTCRKHEKQTV